MGAAERSLRVERELMEQQARVAVEAERRQPWATTLIQRIEDAVVEMPAIPA